MKVLKGLRKQKKLTQQDLAEIIGVDRVTLARYESGARLPSLEVLIKLADFFEVSVDYLLGRTDLPSAKNENKEPVLDESITKAAAHGPDGANNDAIALLNDRLDDILNEVERYKRLINQPGKEE